MRSHQWCLGLCLLPLATSGSAAARFELQVDDSRLQTIEAPPTEAADMSGASAGAAAGLSSAAATPGYTPGAGIAGLVIGLGIAKGMANSSVRKHANAPYEPLRTVYAAHWRELSLRDSLLREWDAHASPEEARCTADPKHKCPATITLRPTFLLLSGARVLGISLEGKLKDGRSTYATTVSFTSQPLPETVLSDINDHWSRENLRAVGEEWEKAVLTLVPLLQTELQRHQPPDRTPSEPIRYVNAAGLFYERGVLLSQDAQRITFRSLDGSITTAYADRLLNTDEYYEWLANKPR